MAQYLEKSRKTAAALTYYRRIVKVFPKSPVGSPFFERDASRSNSPHAEDELGDGPPSGCVQLR